MCSGAYNTCFQEDSAGSAYSPHLIRSALKAYLLCVSQDRGLVLQYIQPLNYTPLLHPVYSYYPICILPPVSAECMILFIFRRTQPAVRSQTSAAFLSALSDGDVKTAHLLLESAYCIRPCQGRLRPLGVAVRCNLMHLLESI